MIYFSFLRGHYANLSTNKLSGKFFSASKWSVFIFREACKKIIEVE